MSEDQLNLSSAADADPIKQLGYRSVQAWVRDTRAPETPHEKRKREDRQRKAQARAEAATQGRRQVQIEGVPEERVAAIRVAAAAIIDGRDLTPTASPSRWRIALAVSAALAVGVAVGVWIG